MSDFRSDDSFWETSDFRSDVTTGQWAHTSDLKLDVWEEVQFEIGRLRRPISGKNEKNQRQPGKQDESKEFFGWSRVYIQMLIRDSFILLNLWLMHQYEFVSPYTNMNVWLIHTHSLANTNQRAIWDTYEFVTHLWVCHSFTLTHRRTLIRDSFIWVIHSWLIHSHFPANRWRAIWIRMSPWLIHPYEFVTHSSIRVRELYTNMDSWLIHTHSLAYTRWRAIWYSWPHRARRPTNVRRCCWCGNWATCLISTSTSLSANTSSKPISDHISMRPTSMKQMWRGG